MPLHTDYRPDKLEDVLGNEETIKGLEQFIKRKVDRPHTYMFMGPAGCGKTTLARLMAKKFKCDESDIVELDIADLRGIDTARNLKSKIKHAPLFGECKAFILDEVHQGTKDFFNALLKVTEEPPDHAYFFLCTTDPQKVLSTIYKRCSKFEVKPVKDTDILELIEGVSEAEGQPINEKTANKIVEVSEGVPREALMILDQVIDLNPKDQLNSIASVEERERQIIDLCRAILHKKNWNVICKILKDINEDEEKIRRAILGYMSSTLLNGKEDAADIMECFLDPFYNTGKPGLVFACYAASIL